MASEPDLEDEGPNVNPRLADYKSRAWRIDQESRRNYLLEEQKRRREETFNSFRDFSDIFNNDDDDEDTFGEDMDFEEIRDVQEKPKFPKLRDLFMLSEWMTELPIDFQDNWILKMCPVGKRCLVRSCKGSTTVYGKRGYQMARFRSALPNGGHPESYGAKYSRSDLTVLDCIWSGALQKYFILDVLYWRSQSYLDTDVKFRSFWIASKLEETPSLSEKSGKNPFPFEPLTEHACDVDAISRVLSRYPYFDSDRPQVDGLLFYHKEGYYAPGTTPLVLWLKPYMLNEMLGENVHIAKEYQQMRPSSYTNMYDFISNYEEARKQKFKKRKPKGTERMEVCAADVDDGF
ncbi:UNVERIFIED_CONTAM: hypothetical protein PYX00_003163 [Menopon gallinae]|uniref:Snurportin-1 n=1 Tax=Menopon gallinae TaxID=328185 RepID=A0AAW2I0M0_9NEOP